LPLVELLGHRNLDDLLLDRISDELRLVVDVEFAHQVKFVCLERFHDQPQQHGDRFDGIASRQQLQDLPNLDSCRYRLTPLRGRLLCLQHWLARSPTPDGRARVTAVWGNDVKRYGAACHLGLPAIGTVRAQQAALQKDFAQCIQGFGDTMVHPGSADAQHLGDFVAGERVQCDQGNHLGVRLAEACKTEFDIAHEDRLVFKAGNSVVSDAGAEKLSPQQRGKPSHLRGDLEKMPHDGEGLSAVAQDFRPGIDLVALFDTRVVGAEQP
jgi:hypothetical protein